MPHNSDDIPGIGSITEVDGITFKSLMKPKAILLQPWMWQHLVWVQDWHSTCPIALKHFYTVGWDWRKASYLHIHQGRLHLLSFTGWVLLSSWILPTGPQEENPHPREDHNYLLVPLPHQLPLLPPQRSRAQSMSLKWSSVICMSSGSSLGSLAEQTAHITQQHKWYNLINTSMAQQCLINHKKEPSGNNCRLYPL